MTLPRRPTPASSDEALSRAIRGAIHDAMEEALTTVSVTAQDGEVTLAGTLASHDELVLVEEAASEVEGVRTLQNLVTVSEPATQRSREVAEELRTALARAFPQVRVSVTVFAGVAVLTGTAPSPGVRQGVEQAVERHRSISRVVSKIELSGPGQVGRDASDSAP